MCNAVVDDARLPANSSFLTGRRNAYLARSPVVLSHLALVGLLATGCGQNVDRVQPPAVENQADETDDSTSELVSQALLVAQQDTRLSAQRNTPWELAHAIMGLGPAIEIHDSKEPRLSLQQYFERGGPYFDEMIFDRTGEDVVVRPSRHPGQFQRHPNQFLAYFGLAGLPLHSALSTDKGTVRIRDLLETAKRQYDPRADNAWTTIAMSIYEKFDSEFTNTYGRRFTVLDVVSNQFADIQSQPACGGLHRLFALALAKQRYESKATDFRIWDEIEAEFESAREHVLASQIADGSFRPFISSVRYDDSENGDWVSRLHSTGHAMEWLIVSATPDELLQPEYDRSIRWVATMIGRNTNARVPAGAWFHALHALRLYHRVIDGQSAEIFQQMEFQQMDEARLQKVP